MESKKKKKKHRKLRSTGEAVKNKRDSPGHSVALVWTINENV